MSILDESDSADTLGSEIPTLGTNAATFWAIARHQAPTEWKPDTIFETASVMIFPDCSALAIAGGRVRAVDIECLATALKSGDEKTPDDLAILAFLDRRLTVAA